MRIVLREDVSNLGKSGEVVTVRAGYGRNYLLPQGLAVAATERNVQQIGLLLEVSIAQQTRSQIGSAQGIPRLAEDMRERLNEYLVAGDAKTPPVKSVAIQDLLVKPQ